MTTSTQSCSVEHCRDTGAKLSSNGPETFTTVDDNFKPPPEFTRLSVSRCLSACLCCKSQPCSIKLKTCISAEPHHSEGTGGWRGRCWDVSVFEKVSHVSGWDDLFSGEEEEEEG